jgi:hypothetical protein
MRSQRFATTFSAAARSLPDAAVRLVPPSWNLEKIDTVTTGRGEMGIRFRSP